MRIEGGEGRSLELRVAGYEFNRAALRPIRWVLGATGAPADFDEDANWLVVEGAASDGRRSWTFRDACLLTVEVRRLAAWLDAVADGWTELEATDFTEPNLEFRRMSSPNEPPVIRVTFRLESRAPWCSDPYEVDHWDDCWLEFDVSAAALRVAAGALRSDLEKFPER